MNARTVGGAAVQRAVTVAWWWGVPVATLWMVLRLPPLEGIELFDLLPETIADLLYWFPATFFGVAVLGSAVWRRRCEQPGVLPAMVWLPTFFLPTYLAGVESLGVLAWCLRCTPGATLNSATALEKMTWGMWLTSEALVVSVIAGGVAARVCGHRSTLGLPVPPVVGAIGASMALQWYLYLHLMTSLVHY